VLKRTTLLLVLLLTACVPAAPTPTPPERSFCGDDVCEGPENRGNCPEDCETIPAVERATENAAMEDAIRVGEEAIIHNPSSGAELVMHIFLSENPVGPTVVLVPGGTGCGSGFRRPGSMSVDVLLDGGVNVVVFDPDGRCSSDGVEDQNGSIHQDGLAAVIRHAAEHPDLDPSRMGMVSISYGITMAAGALSRYPDLPITFLIDYEGPATRNDTGGCDDDQTGHLMDEVACDDESFWRQREALTFMPDVSVPYYRIQTENDHAQPDNEHALQMVNAALEGASPRVWLNDLVVDAPLLQGEAVSYISDINDGRVFALVLNILPEVMAAR